GRAAPARRRDAAVPARGRAAVAARRAPAVPHGAAVATRARDATVPARARPTVATRARATVSARARPPLAGRAGDASRLILATTTRGDQQRDAEHANETNRCHGRWTFLFGARVRVRSVRRQN